MQCRYRMEKGVIHAYEVTPNGYDSIKELLPEKDEDTYANGLLKNDIEDLASKGYCTIGRAQYVPHSFLEFQKDYMEVGSELFQFRKILCCTTCI